MKSLGPGRGRKSPADSHIERVQSPPAGSRDITIWSEAYTACWACQKDGALFTTHFCPSSLSSGETLTIQPSVHSRLPHKSPPTARIVPFIGRREEPDGHQSSGIVQNIDFHSKPASDGECLTRLLCPGSPLGSGQWPERSLKLQRIESQSRQGANSGGWDCLHGAGGVGDGSRES
ncbi:hypothetical protein Q8A67_018066 [Cirrhinus molitorella]|uniref:Uncharacterized protein n=1 Tax=Cirrhinus molitorella TaxID=172907 RepID=A0AA88TH13_9TELE|nr:hypothetical protein Q8A67_018066 [Cirrhinus molitorella]